MSQAPAIQVPTDYESALEFLYGRINYEKISSTPYNAQNYRLDRMRELLNHLDQPHQQYPIIHIAGTKGKGTTATLLYDALRANGMRAGLYTSPHLVRLEERFQFDGRECSAAELVLLCQRVFVAACQVENAGLGRCTFFEITTAMGMLYFAQHQADCVVLEVGLGGRLDSTNVCTPVLSMITSISLDHQAQLGNTLAAIAGEKAGIIKPGIPVISTARAEEARQVIQQVAQNQGAPLLLIDRDFRVQWTPYSWADQEIAQSSEKSASHWLAEGNAVASVEYTTQFEPTSSRFHHSHWPTRMLGRHQADNIAGVVTALQWLTEQAGWKLDIQQSRRAIADSHPSARLEIIDRRPIRIIDTAHNPVSIAAGLQALDDHFSHRPRMIVFACSRDKDYRSMLQNILPHCQQLICTEFKTNPRAVGADSLRQVVNELLDASPQLAAGNLKLEVVHSPEVAWQRAVESCPVDGLVVAMGSFFLAAELFAFLEKKTEE